MSTAEAAIDLTGSSPPPPPTARVKIEQENRRFSFILGWDLNPSSCGYALITNEDALLEWGVVQNTDNQTIEEFSKSLSMKMMKLIADFSLVNVLVVIEEPLYGAKNAGHYHNLMKSYVHQGMLYGIVYGTSRLMFNTEPIKAPARTARSAFQLNRTASTPASGPKVLPIEFAEQATGIRLNCKWKNAKQRSDISDAYVMARYGNEHKNKPSSI